MDIQTGQETHGSSGMKVVILCGGQGTRLREETEYRPKPLVDVGGKPILWHIMKTYAHYQQNNFILCLGYKGDIIKQYFLNYEAMNNDFTMTLGRMNQIAYNGSHTEQDYRVTLADTGAESMTGYRLKQVAKYIEEDTFMVTYGDGLADIDIAALLAFHKAHGKLATVTTVRPQSRYGIVEVDSTNAITQFVEKPQVSSWVSAGYFVFNRKVLDYIDDDINCTFEHGPLERLASDNQLMAYRHDGFFYAMDTYREYLVLNELWNTQQAPWKVWP
jgi:glucose-1-phosphate cytidylyltransferase